MAEPTLKDVLKAIAEVETSIERKVADVRRELVATRTDVAAIRRDQVTIGAHEALRRELLAKFEELDRDLNGHMKVHAELEKDVEALKGRPLRTAARARRGSAKRPAK